MMWYSYNEICKKRLLDLAFKSVLSNKSEQENFRIRAKMENTYKNRDIYPNNSFQSTVQEQQNEAAVIMECKQ